MKRLALPLVVLFTLTFAIVTSCSKEEKVEQNLQNDIELSIEEKLELGKAQGITSDFNLNSRVAISYTDLCGVSTLNDFAVQNGIYAGPAAYNYYKFYGLAGETVTLSATRVECGMDPVMWLRSGLITDSDDWGTLTYVAGADDNVSPPASCGATCYADPTIVTTLPTTGWYTLAVTDFISCSSNPMEFQLNVSGFSCYIVIDGCDTGVLNQDLGGGVSMQDMINDCATDAKNHGAFVSCVAHLTNQWKKDGLISGADKGAIQSCAAGSNLP